MMSNERLKPCPFCGEEAEMRHDRFNRPYIECIQGCARTPDYWGNYAFIIKTWNTRKPMERIVEKLEQRKNFYENRMGEGIERDLEDWGSVKSYEDAIEILKGGGVDE